MIMAEAHTATLATAVAASHSKRQLAASGAVQRTASAAHLSEVLQPVAREMGPGGCAVMIMQATLQPDPGAIRQPLPKRARRERQP